MKLQERTENNVAIIELEGEADLATVPGFQQRVRAKIEENVPALVLDFSSVTFVNTPVWAVVVEYYQHTHKTGNKLALAGLKDRVEASFNIVRLGEFIEHFPTATEAIKKLDSSSET